MLQSRHEVVVHSLRLIIALLGGFCLAHEALHLPLGIVPQRKSVVLSGQFVQAKEKLTWPLPGTAATLGAQLLFQALTRPRTTCLAQSWIAKSQLSVCIAYFFCIDEQLKTLRQASLASMPLCQRAHHLRMFRDESWIHLGKQRSFAAALGWLMVEPCPSSRNNTNDTTHVVSLHCDQRAMLSSMKCPQSLSNSLAAERGGGHSSSNFVT